MAFKVNAESAAEREQKKCNNNRALHTDRPTESKSQRYASQNEDESLSAWNNRRANKFYCKITKLLCIFGQSFRLSSIKFGIIGIAFIILLSLFCPFVLSIIRAIHLLFLSFVFLYFYSMVFFSIHPKNVHTFEAGGSLALYSITQHTV